MNDHLQTALTEALAIAATARRREQIVEDLYLYTFPTRPLLFICASRTASVDELAIQIIGQFFIATKQMQASRELDALHRLEQEGLQ